MLLYNTIFKLLLLMLQIVASLTDNKGIIYDRNIFKIQATAKARPFNKPIPNGNLLDIFLYTVVSNVINK